MWLAGHFKFQSPASIQTETTSHKQTTKAQQTTNKEKPTERSNVRLLSQAAAVIYKQTARSNTNNVRNNADEKAYRYQHKQWKQRKPNETSNCQIITKGRCQDPQQPKSKPQSTTTQITLAPRRNESKSNDESRSTTSASKANQHHAKRTHRPNSTTPEGYRRRRTDHWRGYYHPCRAPRADQRDDKRKMEQEGAGELSKSAQSSY